MNNVTDRDQGQCDRDLSEKDSSLTSGNPLQQNLVLPAEGSADNGPQVRQQYPLPGGLRRE